MFNSIVMLFYLVQTTKKHVDIFLNKSESHDFFRFHIIIENI